MSNNQLNEMIEYDAKILLKKIDSCEFNPILNTLESIQEYLLNIFLSTKKIAHIHLVKIW